MNSLSWMLYFADVCETAGRIFAIVGTVCAFALVILTIIRSCAFEDYEKKLNDALKAPQRVLVCIAPLLIVLALALPSKETVYAIATSEMGEEVLKTPEASKARQALNAWLDKQIGEQKPEKQQ